MVTTSFKVSANHETKASKIVPEQKAITSALRCAKKRKLKDNLVIIARYQWLVRNKLNLPTDMDTPNLCLTIKEGRLIRAFYSTVMTHVIKKQRYFIQILN